MPILEPAIRPPAEADSFLLQVTLGCSQDHCSFCGAYKKKPFRVKDSSEVSSDIEQYAARNKDTRRVFLMDGDALVLPNHKLLGLLDELRRAFPRLSRVSSYASGCNITRKTDEELKALRARQLSLVYMGLESGSQEVLDRCGKSSRVDEMVEAVRRAAEAGIKSSVIVLLGLGGRKYSREHVQATVQALNRMQPRYLSFLSLMVIPGTPLAKEVARGDFQELSPQELLKESCQIIEGLELNKTVFRCDHASNYLPLEGVFPKDKDRLIALLRAGINGEMFLRPGFLRGL
jgi:radical SAM superfamily enzyme YgiQ (UPF0313 family)